MRYSAGIDAGSSYIKVVLVDEAATTTFQNVVPRGGDIEASCRACFDVILRRHGIARDQVRGITATGYGRKQVTFCNNVITEITALAVGSHALNKTIRCVVDIGGQDSKVIAIDSSGKVAGFVMNHKCSAGTGKFLEVTSASLGVPLEQLGPLSQTSKATLRLSSTCTVFAESEIISCIARGEKTQDIIRALHRAIAGQVRGLFAQLHSCCGGTIAFVGGLASDIGLVDELSDALRRRVLVPPSPQFVGARGAALLSQRADGDAANANSGMATSCVSAVNLLTQE
jgi:predicted CoA-substrate-specific enzyme activase